LSSLRIRPYELLAKRLTEGCKGRDVKVLYLDEKPDAAKTIPGLDPAAIVTVGQEALRKALPHRGASVLVYTMVLSPRDLLPSTVAGVTGVAMLPSPRQELLALQKGFKVHKIALFSNPKVSGPLVKDLQAMAPEGMEFTVVSVRSEGEMLRALEGGLPQVDGLLLVPDATVLTEANLKNLMAASYTRKIPVFGFSPLYLEMGAAATLSVPEEEVANKAVSLALGAANGSYDQVDDLFYLRACTIHLNGEAERRLSLKVDRSALAQFGRIVERR
jgi:ABC-type uncharacterized transport system substrate-binding protein